MPTTEAAEQRARRVTIFRLVLDIFRITHDVHWPHRPLGRDFNNLMVMGAAIALHNEGKKVRVSKVAAYLEMPPETVRRIMAELVYDGLLERDGLTENCHHFILPGPRARVDHVVKMVDAVKRAAARL